MSVTENVVDAEQYKIKQEPYYKPVGNELALYESAYNVAYAYDAQGAHRLW